MLLSNGGEKQIHKGRLIESGPSIRDARVEMVLSEDVKSHQKSSVLHTDRNAAKRKRRQCVLFFLFIKADHISSHICSSLRLLLPFKK